MDKNYYNSVSDLDLQRGGYYPEKIQFFEKNLAHLKKRFGRELRILDIACNDGYLAQIYSKYGSVSGIDLNEEAVKKAKASGIDAVVADVFDMDTVFSGKKFDVIIAGDIIEHVFDTDLFLKKIYAVLDMNGTILLSTPNLVSLGRRIMALFGKNPFCEFSGKKDGINVGHIRYYTFADLEKQLAETGFSMVKTEGDTTNLPVKFVDKFVVALFPHLGREILAKAHKL